MPSWEITSLQEQLNKLSSYQTKQQETTTMSDFNQFKQYQERVAANNDMLTQIGTRGADGFTAEYKTPQNFVERYHHGLGCAIATHCGWDGIAVMRIFAAALEDANWHSECAEVNKWIDAQQALA